MVAILDHMSALADPTRCRILLLLEQRELTVSELCAVLQIPQSSVSRHLKTLADDDWVASRRDGTSRFYSMPLDDLDSGASRLWPLIREQVAATAAAGQDERRLRGVLSRRRAKSQAVPSRVVFHAWRSEAQRVPGWAFTAPDISGEKRTVRAQKLKLARRLFLEALGLRRPR